MINLCSFTTGRRKKNNPKTIKKMPTYFQGSLNFSPNTIIAAKDSIKALNPSQAAFTNKTCEPCKDLIKKYITPRYPTEPTVKFCIPPLFENSL